MTLMTVIPRGDRGRGRPGPPERPTPARRAPAALTRASLGAIALALALAPPPARATTVRALSLPAMTAAAQSIVRGRVLDARAVYDPRREAVYTHTTVRVDEVLWGREVAGQELLVRQRGGTLDGVTWSVPGTPRLELGAEVLLFCRTDGAFHYIVGMAQGAYTLSRPPGAAAPRGLSAQRHTAGLRALSRPLVARRLAPQRAPYAALRAQVQAALRDLGRRPGAARGAAASRPDSAQPESVEPESAQPERVQQVTP